MSRGRDRVTRLQSKESDKDMKKRDTHIRQANKRLCRKKVPVNPLLVSSSSSFKSNVTSQVTGRGGGRKTKTKTRDEGSRRSWIAFYTYFTIQFTLKMSLKDSLFVGPVKLFD